MDLKKITLVSSSTFTPTDSEMCFKLSVECDVELHRLKYIEEIFPLLSDPTFYTDYIVFNTNELHNVDAYDLVRTLYTLINCTVYRDGTSIKPVKRSTKIIAMVSEDTHADMFTDLMSMPEIFNFTLKHGGIVTYEMVKTTVENFLADNKEIPKVIANLFKHKKVNAKINKETINLTNRQRQIFDIVVTRGSSNKHIAKMLSISESTVKLHVSAILKKYSVKNRTQLAVFSKRKTTNADVHV